MNLPSSHINRGGSLGALTPVRDLLCTTPLSGKKGKGSGVTNPVPTKSRRVRTGCLTCRERHLKCDEGLPDCLNCRKSNRHCKRGVRLNFIDIQVKQPPRLLPPTADWSVQFQDDSRHIASEYVGGIERYAHLPKVSEEPAVPAAPAHNHLHSHMHAGHLDATLRHQAHFQPQGQAVLDRSGSGNSRFFPPSTPPTTTYGYHGANAMGSDTRPLVEGPPLRHDNPFPTPQTSTHPAMFYPMQDSFGIRREDMTRSHGHRNSDASSAASVAQLATGPPSSFRGVTHGHLAQDGMMTPPPSEKAAVAERDHLNSEEEMYYMQVFVEEVGVWMDSLDRDKHFSHIMPYSSLKSPMLLNAFLACGLKHLTLTNPDWKDDKALYYYDTATTQLLRSLQNPDRNTAECATTAVVLNVYEVMSEKPGQSVRMHHIAGARALIRECGWDARADGVGAACFWLNIGMEVLSCLAFNWQTSWDPDQWGLDLDFASNNPDKRDADGTCAAGFGREEEWVHRIFYIVAKIANFRATAPKYQESSPHDEQIQRGSRLAQWQELKRLCDRWNNACPRTMHPLGYVQATQVKSRSAFPNVWLIKRAATIGRLFYHTAQCVLAQTNPMEPSKGSEEMRVLQLHHAHQVCGIVAHSRDRGVGSVAIRCLAVAGAVLTNPREQEEVLHILRRIHVESGWHLGTVTDELKKTWGWVPGGDVSRGHTPGAMPMSIVPSMPEARAPVGGLHGLSNRVFDPTGVAISAPNSFDASAMSQAPQSQPTASRVNPLSSADFSLPNHPYQNWYEPPNRSGSYASQAFL
ncbi:C6 zinc finger domain-containing protein [Plectosphaerella plurivora]|uniref:C6 zinc finger domain-containing protein n=1 Tax=Plectosphaerella plurivora TaxID=936078 RepID=A0A9P8UYM0_9PEZI|nr:C6 zinc finger domain-containing protein [Plectosphaerella plurivora]